MMMFNKRAWGAMDAEFQENEHPRGEGGKFAGTAPGKAGSPERISHHKEGHQFHKNMGDKHPAGSLSHSEHLDAEEAHRSAFIEHHGAAKGVTNPTFADTASEKARKASAIALRV